MRPPAQRAQSAASIRADPQAGHPLGRYAPLGNAGVQRAVRSGERPKPLIQRARALSEDEKALDLKSPAFAGDPRLESAYDNDPAMRRGEQGEAVAKVQQALIDDGFELPISTKKTGAPDGIYGRETFRTVKEFQEKQDLSIQDGAVGRETLGKLDELAPEKPSEAMPAAARPSLKPAWQVEVLTPLTEVAEILRADPPGRDSLASAYEKLKQVVVTLLSVSDTVKDDDRVDLSRQIIIRQLYLNTMMLGRAIQPFIGKKTDYSDIVDEAGVAESTAAELQPDVSAEVPAWNDRVVAPIGEAAALIKGNETGGGSLAAAREKLSAAARCVRNAAAEGSLEPFVSSRLWRFYMQLRMLERALHPYTGARTDLSRMRDEADLAKETASDLAAELP